MPRLITKYTIVKESDTLKPRDYESPTEEIKEEEKEEIEDLLKAAEAKHDTGKIQMSLVPSQIIKDIAAVRMYGTNKYKSPANWITVEKQRYIDALLRHLYEYLDDNNAIDEESGLPTIAHVACNIAFLCEMERPDWEERKIQIMKKYGVYNENTDTEVNAQ